MKEIRLINPRTSALGLNNHYIIFELFMNYLKLFDIMLELLKVPKSTQNIKNRNFPEDILSKLPSMSVMITGLNIQNIVESIHGNMQDKIRQHGP